LVIGSQRVNAGLLLIRLCLDTVNNFVDYNKTTMITFVLTTEKEMPFFFENGPMNLNHA